MRELEKNEVIELSKKLWDSKKMQKYLQGDFIYYELENGGIIHLKKKCSIDNTIYYDDETEAPNVTENFFIHYNMKNFYSEYHEIIQEYECTPPYLIYNYCNNKDIVAVCSYKNIADYEKQLKWAKNKDLFVRFMTKEEQEEYKQIIENVKNKYIERLKKYYKRYNNKITTYGYWANR